MKKSILFSVLFAASVITALLFAGCGEKGTEAGSENWEGDVDALLQRCCGGKGIQHEYGALVDTRDGKKYKTIEIGGATWMAENLNYTTPDSSWCYDDDASKCGKYGRLYAFNAARAACPTGWHLSTSDEWYALTAKDGYMAGKKLKSSSGWDPSSYCTGSGCPDYNGTDTYGFSAMPGGCRYTLSYNRTGFNRIGESGYWWTDVTGNISQYSNIEYRSMSNTSHEVTVGSYSNMSEGYSVRCVKN